MLLLGCLILLLAVVVVVIGKAITFWLALMGELTELIYDTAGFMQLKGYTHSVNGDLLLIIGASLFMTTVFSKS